MQRKKADNDLEDYKRTGGDKEGFAALRLKGIRKDAADEGEKKRQRPEPWRSLHTSSEEYDKNQKADEWCGVSEVARAADE